MSMGSSGNVVTLPPGVTISSGRETMQSGPSGNNIAGMNFTLTLANGSTTSVFVPYTLMKDVSVVEAMFAQRIADINGVMGSGA